MQLWTPEHIKTCSTAVLLDNLVDFSQQLAGTKVIARQVRLASHISFIKNELRNRAAA